MKGNKKLCFSLSKLQKHTECFQLLREIKFYLKSVSFKKCKRYRDGCEALHPRSEQPPSTPDAEKDAKFNELVVKHTKFYGRSTAH